MFPAQQWRTRLDGYKGPAAAHKTLEEAGYAALVGWVGHPAVRRICKAAKPGAEAVLAYLGWPEGTFPLDQWQVPVCRITLYAYNANVVAPDGTFILPNVDNHLMRLPEVHLWRDYLERVVKDLAKAGVPLDPRTLLTPLAVAQLLICAAPWDAGAAAIADSLNVVSFHGIIHEPLTPLLSVRHGSDRADRAITQIFRAYCAATGEARSKAPYAGSKRRKSPGDTVALRRLLARLVKAAPTMTPTKLHAYLDAATLPAVKQFRDAYQKDQEARHKDDPDWAFKLPSLSTLKRNWPKGKLHTS